MMIYFGIDEKIWNSCYKKSLTVYEHKLKKMAPINFCHFFPLLLPSLENWSLTRGAGVFSPGCFNFFSYNFKSHKAYKDRCILSMLNIRMLHYHKVTQDDFRDFHSQWNKNNRDSSGLQMTFSSSPWLTTGLISHLLTSMSLLPTFHGSLLPSHCFQNSQLCIHLTSK